MTTFKERLLNPFSTLAQNARDRLLTFCGGAILGAGAVVGTLVAGAVSFAAGSVAFINPGPFSPIMAGIIGGTVLSVAIPGAVYALLTVSRVLDKTIHKNTVQKREIAEPYGWITGIAVSAVLGLSIANQFCDSAEKPKAALQELTIKTDIGPYNCRKL